MPPGVDTFRGMHHVYPIRRKALICGIGGQDGAYLAQHLVAQGYDVIGTSRDAGGNRFEGLQKVGLHGHVTVASLSLVDPRAVAEAIAAIKPDEIYNLAGQSSVGLSFDRPAETFESIIHATTNLLEAIRHHCRTARFYSAGSSEMFGNRGEEACSEDTPLHPLSPYGVAKASAFWQVASYRTAYGLHACTGILFNHESPLRSERFVTQKIVSAACSIAAGKQRQVALGDLSIRRDWGWAPEYVVAMHKMLQLDVPEDLVIATGRSSSLEDFVRETFAAVGLDWRRHVVHDPSMRRPRDIPINQANPQRARIALGWTARIHMPEVARLMVAARLGQDLRLVRRAA